MTEHHKQGRRSADHIALLGLTEIASRNPSGDKSKPGQRIFVGGSLAPRHRSATCVPPVVEVQQPPPVDDGQRDADLRQQAATLLGDRSDIEKRQRTAPAAAEPEKISPFVMAAMLLLAGLIFLMVIPPVGVTFLLCAVLPVLWGAGSAVLKSSS